MKRITESEFYERIEKNRNHYCGVCKYWHKENGGNVEASTRGEKRWDTDPDDLVLPCVCGICTHPIQSEYEPHKFSDEVDEGGLCWESDGRYDVPEHDRHDNWYRITEDWLWKSWEREFAQFGYELVRDKNGGDADAQPPETA